MPKSTTRLIFRSVSHCRVLGWMKYRTLLVQNAMADEIQIMSGKRPKHLDVFHFYEGKKNHTCAFRGRDERDVDEGTALLRKLVLPSLVKDLGYEFEGVECLRFCHQHVIATLDHAMHNNKRQR